MVQVLVFIEATLLTMIHNFRTSKPMSIGSETDPDRLYVWDCLLEMAHKYEMSEVSKEIAQDLSSQWPVTLRDWDIMVSTRRAIFGSKNVDHPSYRINYPEPAVAIAFCRRFELNPRSRAAALYALSTIPANQKMAQGSKGEMASTRFRRLPRSRLDQRSAQSSLSDVLSRDSTALYRSISEIFRDVRLGCLQSRFGARSIAKWRCIGVPSLESARCQYWGKPP